MIREREKRATLEPLYRIAKALLPKLGVSQQNLLYYASLANFYTVYDLRNLKADQTHLYLLCYAWQRYRQLSDNLVDAMAYHMKQLEDESRARASKSFVSGTGATSAEHAAGRSPAVALCRRHGGRRHAVRRACASAPTRSCRETRCRSPVSA